MKLFANGLHCQKWAISVHCTNKDVHSHNIGEERNVDITNYELSICGNEHLQASRELMLKKAMMKNDDFRNFTKKHRFVRFGYGM